MIERQFTGETEDVILERMKDRVDKNIDKRQGSVTHDMTVPASFEIAQVYQALDDVIALGLNVTEESPDEFVDLKVKWSGITPRKEAIQSIGTLTFTGEDGTVIPVGTQARTDEVIPVFFHTIEEGTIINGFVTINAIADVGGISGNVEANRVVISLGNLTGVTAVTNSEFIGGVDRETNEALLDRYYEKVRRPATSGNIYHYEQWAKEVPGVKEVKVKPVWNGPNTVKLILLNDQMESPDPVVITNTTDHIASVKPIGADVTIVGATELSINVSAQLTLSPDAVISDVASQFAEGLRTYLQSVAFMDNQLTNQPELIRYTRIANVLLDIPSVIDYSNLLVNGVTSNIQPTDEEVGVVGTVTFT